jgi:aminoglycoside phosphotransferase (APT) family kinase protein
MSDDVLLAPEAGAWLRNTLCEGGPLRAERLTGGNSNETILLTGASGRWVLRRPPVASVSASGHSVAREFRVLKALSDTAVSAPRAIALCEDAAIQGTPFIVMSHVTGSSLTDVLPSAWLPADGAITDVGVAVIDALATLHDVDWRAAGLEGFGRPEGYLERQVERWASQYATHQVRELPDFDQVADWLERNLPAGGSPSILHGDFHLDNCLIDNQPGIHVAGIIDWEMATIGEPLVDLGLFLAFWGSQRPVRPAMPWVQAISRGPDAPTRAELAARYADRTGRSIADLSWFMAFAFWKLAAIVEGAYALCLAGKLDTAYARSLEHNVPRLLSEAAAIAHC